MYLIFGGTGSLGKTLVARLLKKGEKVTVFSRDEAKHHELRRTFPGVSTIVGDIRSFDAVSDAIEETRPRVIINAAAMKQIPLCEEHPYEALLTNSVGTHHLIRAAKAYARKHRGLKVISVSTDKAAKPVNAYGMTKALQERIHLRGNGAGLIATCVRYGNVLESTGSIIPLFKEKIARGESLPITDPSMTRFLLGLDEAVDLIFLALKDKEGGKIFIPKVPAATVGDIAEALIQASGKKITKKILGIRPGEKVHEILISEEETFRTEEKKSHFLVHGVSSKPRQRPLKAEYSSKDHVLPLSQVEAFLRDRHVV